MSALVLLVCVCSTTDVIMSFVNHGEYLWGFNFPPKVCVHLALELT